MVFSSIEFKIHYETGLVRFFSQVVKLRKEHKLTWLNLSRRSVAEPQKEITSLKFLRLTLGIKYCFLGFPKKYFVNASYR